MLIAATAFTDLAGNAYAGISAKTDWNFSCGSFPLSGMGTINGGAAVEAVKAAAGNLTLCPAGFLLL